MSENRPGLPGGLAELLSAAFPETRSALLAEAAAGEWERFFAEYLLPCWREVLLSCRARNVPVDEADDLLQELFLRLMQEGTSRGEAAGARGNLPGRFLDTRARGLATARFRTVLKKVIRNLLLEHLRLKRRDARPGPAVPEPWVEDSVSLSVDRHWLAHCLSRAACRLREQSAQARTRGEQRLYRVLYLTAVEAREQAAIAREMGVDRTTVAGLLGRVRRRFVRILGEVTGVDDAEELRGRVAAAPELFVAALAAAGA